MFAALNFTGLEYFFLGGGGGGLSMLSIILTINLHTDYTWGLLTEDARAIA